jgi:hypothetical protein
VRGEADTQTAAPLWRRIDLQTTTFGFVDEEPRLPEIEILDTRR